MRDDYVKIRLLEAVKASRNSALSSVKNSQSKIDSILNEHGTGVRRSYVSADIGIEEYWKSFYQKQADFLEDLMGQIENFEKETDRKLDSYIYFGEKE